MMNTQQKLSQSDNAERIVSAMERVLRPFIRLFVGRVSCGFMIQRMKRVYIEEARSWIEKNESGGRVTKSKLAMLTGLDTRTIAAIENSQSSEIVTSELCAEAAVLYHWTNKLEYQDDQGSPLELPIMGKGSSFQALVTSSVGRNVTYHTLLDRLIDSGNIEIVSDNSVKLVSPYYTPIKASEQTVIDAGSASISRLIKTIEHNLVTIERDHKHLQQDRWSPLIPCQYIDEVNRRVREKIEQNILEVEEILDEYEVSENEVEKACTYGIGWYIFR